MRRAVLAISFVLLLAAIWLWGLGGADRLALWAAAGQEQTQRALAGALRALRAGQPGALAALWGLCFTYGFFHAAGPGHGKILIGGYGLGAQVPLARLSALALAASLAQGATAVLLVGLGATLLGWGRETLIDAAEAWFAPISYGAIAVVGLWLCWRGLRGLGAPAWIRQQWQTARTAPMPLATAAGSTTHATLVQLPDDPPAGFADLAGNADLSHKSCAHGSAHGHTHGHPHGHEMPTHRSDGHHSQKSHALGSHAHGTQSDDHICITCGHAHGPSLEEAQNIRSWRDAAALVGAIALRPCTGAIFVLILTFRWGLIWQGISAVLAMAIGVAAVTITVGIAAVTLREGALRQSLARLSDGAAARAMNLVEISAGALIALAASGLALRALSGMP